MARILFIDDDPDFTSAVQALLKDEGHAVSIASGLSEARATMESERFDIQFVDLMLPDGSGLELVTEDGPSTVVITGHPSIESAVRAIRGPVIDYLVKPVDERALLDAIARALSDTSGRIRVAGGSRTTNNQTHDQIIGDSACMRDLRETVREYGATDITVLITGESGTGKELVAQALHQAWNPARPFAAVNCGAIPQDLLASELFGHEKGSFTGAAARRKGLFERAEGGIVFLDEIGELPQQQQIALLRVLETRTIQRVGAEKEISVSARVVAATNRNLEKQVDEGAFREDLFYRINVLTIHVPPLRERGGDLEQLAAHYLAQYAAQYSTPESASAEALARLGAYHWPGNVRELKHTLLRAAILNRGRARVEKLPDDFERPPGWAGHADAMVPGMSIREVEKSLIEKTLDHFSGDKKMTADALGVSVKTLYNRLKDYETSPSEG
ncbi:MAG: sigma-54 dependent transcriptional regulator [Woeseia sp.]